MYMSNEKKLCIPNCNPVYNLQENGISRKMLISQMIQKKHSIDYANSYTSSIYKTLLSLDFDSNKKLLISMKYILYIKYFKQLISCGKYNSELFYLMIDTIIGSLTSQEYDIVFNIKTNIDPNTPTVDVTNLIITNTFYVAQDIDKKFFVIQNYNGEYIEMNKSYKFNLEHSTNLNTRICFSQNESGTPIPVNELVYNGIPGNPGANLIVTISSAILSSFKFNFNIYTFNSLSKESYSWGYAKPYISILPPKRTVYSFFTYQPLFVNQTSYLSVYYNQGLKFLIQNSFIISNASVNYNYIFYYGTYYLNVPKKYSLAILNKGQEDKIQYTGVINTSTRSTVDSTTSDGTYHFFYDTLVISVYEAFEPISLYSKLYGYLGTGNAINFDSTAADFAQPAIRTDHPIDANGIESVYGQTRVYVDYLNNIITLNNDVNNKSTSTSYGVYNGTYIFYSSELITFLNKGKENIFVISGLNGIKGPGPDGITNYTFYSGVIQVKILGDFNKMSMYTFNRGYCGGLYLLNYNEYYNTYLPHSYPFTTIKNDALNDPPVKLYDTFIPLNSTTLDFSKLEGTTTGKPKNSYNIITTDSNGNFVFLDFNGNIIPYSSTTQYTMSTGTYVFFNLTNQFITFMTKNKPVNAVGYNIGIFFTSGTSPNGDIYTFNISDQSPLALLKPIIVKVTGNFEYLSICTQNGYNGGQHLFSYAYNIPLNSTNIDFSKFDGKDNKLINNYNTAGKPINSYNVITTDSNGKFVFKDLNGNIIPYRSTARYTMTIGTYIFFNITNQFITFMTKNKPVNALGYSIDDYFTSGTAPNGDVYTFNKSKETNVQQNTVLSNPIIVKVTGNFDYLSICSESGYNGGENLFYYN